MTNSEFLLILSLNELFLNRVRTISGEGVNGLLARASGLTTETFKVSKREDVRA